MPVRGPQWPIGYETWIERLVELIKELIRGGPIRWIPMPRADELIRMLVEKLYKTIRWLGPKLQRFWRRLVRWLRQWGSTQRNIVRPFVRGLTIGRPFLCVAALANALRSAAMSYTATALGELDMNTIAEQSYFRCTVDAFRRLFDGELHGRAEWCPFGNPRAFRAVQAVIGQMRIPLAPELVDVGVKLSLRFCARAAEWYARITAGPAGFALRQLAVMWAYMYGAAFPLDIPPHPKYLEALSIESITESEFHDLLRTFKKVYNYCWKKLAKLVVKVLPVSWEALVWFLAFQTIPLYPGPLWVRIEGFEIDIPDLASFAGAAAESLSAAGLHGLLGLLQRYYWI